MKTCMARQFSDQMHCPCGNTWDVNDSDPPVCRQSGGPCQCHRCDTPIKRSLTEWDLFFFAEAGRVSALSKDPDRKVGSIILTPDRRKMSFGYNGFPPEIEDRPSLLADRAFKNANMVHAEDNALRQCPFDPSGCTLYVTRFPCYGCARRIVDSQVARVVAPVPDFSHPRWGDSWRQSKLLMECTGIKVQMMLEQAHDEEPF